MKALFAARFNKLILGVLLGASLAACSKPSNKAELTQQNPPKKAANSNAPDWQKDFPAIWWQEVPRDQAKSWEILPQDAGFKEVILSKRNELGLISNFADTSFVYHGVCYPTVEAFWQMMKYPETENDPRWSWAKPWKYTRAQVTQLNGYVAKSAGNYANFLMDKNDANWITFEGKVIPFATMEPQEHYRLIWEASIEKLRQNPQVLKVLLSTKDLMLRPDHQVSDEAPPEWHYYQLWTKLRELVQNNQLSLESKEDLSLKTCKGLNN
jgi:hypothetical protein